MARDGNSIPSQGVGSSQRATAGRKSRFLLTFDPLFNPTPVPPAGTRPLGGSPPRRTSCRDRRRRSHGRSTKPFAFPPRPPWSSARRGEPGYAEHKITCLPAISIDRSYAPRPR